MYKRKGTPTKTDKIKYAVYFWGFTVLAGVYLIPAMILAFINPFWFRKSFHRVLSRQIDYLWDVRSDLVKPIVMKYLTSDSN